MSQSLGKLHLVLSTVGTEYAPINVGALDDQISSGGLVVTPQIIKKEKFNIVTWEQVLMFMVLLMIHHTADGEIQSQTYVHPETYSGLSLTPYDIDFGGTSSACPTVAGWITTKLQYNRDWTLREM